MTLKLSGRECAPETGEGRVRLPECHRHGFMKSFILTLFLMFAGLQSQAQIYIGAQAASRAEEHQIMFGYQLREHFIIAEPSILYNHAGYRLNLQLGARIFRKKDISLYFYLPYWNFNVEKKKYNTPFKVAFFWDNPVPTDWFSHQLSLGVDVYRDLPIVMLQWRVFMEQNTCD